MDIFRIIKENRWLWWNFWQSMFTNFLYHSLALLWYTWYTCSSIHWSQQRHERLGSCTFCLKLSMLNVLLNTLLGKHVSDLTYQWAFAKSVKFQKHRAWYGARAAATRFLRHVHQTFSSHTDRGKVFISFTIWLTLAPKVNIRLIVVVVYVDKHPLGAFVWEWCPNVNTGPSCGVHMPLDIF